ncbi:MAG: hypothetical protein COT17_00330 [Elusimicrobia bacterium CG08_land_8_20_14_0_20_51_18]|nr:MAG: hypothetical protein COT17_00330 [Elusimicrobia bacterium CG08_land_8_20_14_0_20_51_18]
MDYKSTLTYKDILEIPGLLRKFDAGVKDFGKLKSADNEVFVLGRGSSGNATTFAKYVWEIYCGVITNFIHPYSVFNAVKRLDFRNKVLWSYSQSGKSRDIVECSKKIKKFGARVVAVTNEPDPKKNELAAISDFHILLSRSREIPVAATKSFALQLWLALRAAQKWGASFPEKRFADAIKEVEKVISSFERIYKAEKFREAIKRAKIIGFVGRGPFNAVAEDSALKFREMAFKHAAGYSAAEFLHGPIGAYGKNDLVLILSGEGKLTEDLVKVRNKLEERGTRYKVIKPFPGAYPFNSLATDVFIKLLALKFACDNGVNPDAPKGLSKVTQTY